MYIYIYRYIYSVCAVCDFLKWVVLEPIKKRARAFISHNEDDYRGYLGLDERSSVMPIHQADTYLSKTRTEMCHCSHVVVTGFDVARLVMAPWVTAGPLIVSQALPWPPMSLFVRHTYSNTVSYQWKISHKGQMVRLICGDDSVNTEENDNHFNLLSKFQLYIKRNSSSVMENTFQCSLIV